MLGKFLGSLERDLTKDVDPNVDFYKGRGPQNIRFHAIYESSEHYFETT